MLVLKIGGSRGIDLDALCDDVAALWHDGARLILVHGGSHRTNEVATALGHPPRFVTSPSGYTSRRTDRRTLEIFQMVYCGEINKGIVERLQQRGVNALGMSGLDGRLWQGPRKAAIRIVEGERQRILRDDYTGNVTRVNRPLLELLLANEILPVLTPPALSDEGEAINVDGDRAAAATAAAMGARCLLILSNVPGLLRAFPDEGSLIRDLAAGELEGAERFAEGRMRIKLLGAREALAGGVPRVILADGRVERPVRRALAGGGTHIVTAREEARV